MSITNRLFFAFTLLLFSLGFANAKAISFTASAPTEVARNQVFELFYTLEGGSSGGLNDKIQVDKAVDVIYGPIRKDLATVEIIEGKRTGVIKESYKYKLRILEEGTFTVPSLTIEVGGVKYISNSIDINVISPDKVKKKATFSARISPKEVTQNRLFKLIYKLEGAKGNDLKIPPSVVAFKYLSDPSIVIDSVPVYTETYTYLLEAIEPGTYILPSATILADGELLTSSTLKLTIETKDLVVRENGDGGFISMVQLIISKLNTYYSLGFIILIGPASIYCLYRGRTKKEVRWTISGAILLSIIIQFILLYVVTYIIVSLIK